MVSETFAGKYRLDALIGEGGMGRVYSATHLRLGTSVAIKVLKADAMVVDEVVQRFIREARAASRLQSRHVCRVHDVDQLATGEPYMVMELLRGVDLHRLVRTRGRLSVERAVGYVLEACEALGEAHALGMVHRDIKPANLFLVEPANGEQHIKVLDFGIATRAKGETDGGLTRTASVMGSPNYMSPEQLRSAKDVDARSDIWALGVTLYELVSGGQPFAGDTFSALSIAIATDPHAPLSGVHPQLVSVIDRCLAKRPSDRYATVSEFADALSVLTPAGPSSSARVARALAPGLAATLLPSEELPARSQKGAQTTRQEAAGQSVRSTESPRPTSRLPLFVAGLAVIPLAGIGIWMATRTSTPKPPDDSGSAAVEGPAATAAPMKAVGVDAGVDAQTTAATSSLNVDALVAEYKAESAEVAKLREQVERARALGDQSLVDELTGKIRDRESKARAKTDSVLESQRAAFIRTGSPEALQTLASAMKLSGDPQAAKMDGLVQLIARKEPLPRASDADEIITDAALFAAQTVTKAGLKEIAAAFDVVEEDQLMLRRSISIGASSKDVEAARSRLHSDMEVATNAAKSRLVDLKKAYALDGKPDQLLVVSAVLRLAGETELSRELCGKYAALASTSVLLPNGLDEDKDGIPSCADECPTKPGDKKSTNGCPTSDADGDGIADKDDQCPNEPETINGYHDKDGCPDTVSYCETGVGTSGACFGDEDSCTNGLSRDLHGADLRAMGAACVLRAADGGHRPVNTAPQPAADTGSASHPILEISPECKANPLAKGCS